MKRFFIYLALLFSFSAVAVADDAVALLEKARKNIEADRAVQFVFDYTVCDEEGVALFADNGSFKFDGDRYSLLLGTMKLWCDGVTQWSYINQTDEIYIATADAEEARLYNPSYLMGLYREGYVCSAMKEAGEVCVTMVASDDAQEFEKAVLSLDEKTLRPLSMEVYMSGQGCVKVKIDSYKPKCDFADRVYVCPMEDFPSAEIVDMR